MVKLRLRRKGRRHHPVYDIVAVDSRKKRDGAFIERLGYYDPNSSPSTIKVDPDRAVYWLNVGAQTTDVVRKLLQYEGILLRKAMHHKGNNQVEIEEAVEKHKEYARERFFRKKQERKQKKQQAEKEKEAAEKAEAEGTVEAPAAEEASAKTETETQAETTEETKSEES